MNSKLTRTTFRILFAILYFAAMILAINRMMPPPTAANVNFAYDVVSIAIRLPFIGLFFAMDWLLFSRKKVAKRRE
jgi:hypothetical protein